MCTQFFCLSLSHTPFTLHLFHLALHSYFYPSLPSLSPSFLSSLFPCHLFNQIITRLFVDLKQEIQDFETSFVEKHNYKPTHSDKEPIREQLEELTRLRLQRKQTKQLMETGREKRGKEERNRLTSTRGVTVSASHHSELRSIDTISAREEVKEHNSSQVRSQQTKKIQGEHATCSPPSLTASTTTAARSRQDVRNSTASPSLLQISPSTSPLPHSTYPPLLQSSAISSTDSATSTANATTVTTTHTTATTTSTVGTTTVTIDSATATIGSATGTTGTIADGSRSNLEQKLKKIMASLSEKRRKAGRPAELKVCVYGVHVCVCGCCYIQSGWCRLLVLLCSWVGGTCRIQCLGIAGIRWLLDIFFLLFSISLSSTLIPLLSLLLDLLQLLLFFICLNFLLLLLLLLFPLLTEYDPQSGAG